MDELEKRKEAVLEKLKQATKNPLYIIYALLGAIITIGVYIRTRNLGIIQWQFPLDPDSFAFLRYATYIAEHGHLMEIDMLRYYPLGWTNLSEFRVVSYFVAYLYKILHLFIPSITIQNADILYPVICFAAGMIFFFLFVKKLFNWKIGLAATTFLAVCPAYLYRTMAGSADKEAFATMAMFATLYFFITAWKSETIKKTAIFGILSGIALAITGSVWGGYVFILLTISSFTFINLLLGKTDNKKILAYALWFLIGAALLNQLYPERFYLKTWISSVELGLSTLTFFLCLATYLAKRSKALPEKINELTKGKLPAEFLILSFVLLIGVIGEILIHGPSGFLGQIRAVYITLTEPFGTNRWVLTVAEDRLPYFTEWISQFEIKYLLITFLGAAFAFHTMIKSFQKKILPTIIFTTALLLIAITRYSPGSIFSGTDPLSRALYFGAILTIGALFLYPYVMFFKKDKPSFEKLQNIDQSILLGLLLLFFLALSARTAIRLLFILSPGLALFAGYFIISAFKKLKMIKTESYKLIGYALLIVLLGILLVNATQASLNQARYTGSSYTYQWQQAMNWVRENTPQDAVFAHWWDYGYYVQTGSGRATLSDGGNARGAINYFIGRHVLTAQNETEALELLKANNATHFLVVYEEIGKYPAFSSIGSDGNYDRYSWITTFQFDPAMVQETRNETILVYRGATALDEDFMYQDKIYPEGATGIGAVLIPVQTTTSTEGNETKSIQQMKQPSVIMAYQGQQLRVPLECIFIDGKEVIFPEPGYGGCLRIIPSVDGNNQVNQIGAGLLLSPKVRRTLFTKLFLYDQPSEHFKKVYTDEDKGMPLAVYQGRLIGPLKIWEISYPSNLTIPPEYYGIEEPEEVTVVGKKFK